MLPVMSDALTAADGQHVMLFGLLDMSAACDCVDHDLLLQRLDKHCDLKGDVLRWMTSFLTQCMQQWHVIRSTMCLLRHTTRIGLGGPVHCTVYTADLNTIHSVSWPHTAPVR